MKAGRLVAAALALALGACVSRMPPDAPGEPEIRDTLAVLGGSDGRAAYSALVCPQVMAAGRNCDAVLRAPGEVAVQPAVVPASEAPRPRLVFVGGMFAECASGWLEPFGDAIAAFRAEGYDTRAVGVAGRGTAAANAARIVEVLRALPDDGGRVVAFAYSKGVVDVLEALVRHPWETRAVAAVISVAGAQGGSPLAETRADLYASVGAVMPMGGCAPGTGEELLELRRDARRAWWARHGRDVQVPILSLVALPRDGRLSPFIGIAARELSRLDRWNDGNVLWRDAIGPRATLLGFVDADHWTIALPIARDLPLLRQLFSDDVPRPVLMRAALAIAVSKATALR